jgi:hypothetical protein
MRLIDCLLNLYPSSWRERYKDEFRALLDQSFSGRDVLDIIGGALDARLSPQYRSSNGDNMEAKRLLQIAGGGALLCVLLMFGAVVNRTQQGWFDAGLMLMGMVIIIPVSVVLHIACHQRETRKSQRIFLLTAACLAMGIVIFLLLRQQPNGDLTLSWQHLYIGGTFGLWIALNSRLAHATGLIPHWGMSLGVASGALWLMMALVMVGMQFNPMSTIWMILIYAVAAVWLAVHLVWLSSLALAVFAPKQQLAVSD